MKTTHPHHNKPQKQHHHLKPPNRTTTSSSLFSCAFFRHCSQSDPLSPPSHHHHHHLPLSLPNPSPPLPPPHQPPLPPHHHHYSTNNNSESSSSSTSQSFTQWRFPPTFHDPDHHPSPPAATPPPSAPPPLPPSHLRELFHVAELHFTAGSDSDRLSALHMLERSLVPNPPSESGGPHGGNVVVVPTAVMSWVVGYLKETRVAAKSATKVLLALCLSEGNRRVAVECGAAARVVDALPDLEGTVAERALAALDLMCTVAEGAAEVRAHVLAVPMLVTMMGRMEGRGKEYAISVLAAVYGGGGGSGEHHHQLVAVAPPEEVARAVVLAMQQRDCTARGKRKGALLLKALQDNASLHLALDV